MLGEWGQRPGWDECSQDAICPRVLTQEKPTVDTDLCLFTETLNRLRCESADLMFPRP
jgi:hypothetical protein